jgi:hypothetical protein
LKFEKVEKLKRFKLQKNSKLKEVQISKKGQNKL